MLSQQCTFKQVSSQFEWIGKHLIKLFEYKKFILKLCNKIKFSRFKFVALNFLYFIEIMADVLSVVVWLTMILAQLKLIKYNYLNTSKKLQFWNLNVSTDLVIKILRKCRNLIFYWNIMMLWQQGLIESSGFFVVFLYVYWAKKVSEFGKKSETSLLSLLTLLICWKKC